MEEATFDAKASLNNPVEKFSIDSDFSVEEERKLLRRLDIRLVVTCGVLLCVSLMDRTNLSQGAIAGMRKDLSLLQGYRYSLVALIFFISYTLFQLPSMAMLRAVGPRPFLAGVTIAWGITMLGSGFVTNWHQILPLRFILGIFEAGSYPGSIYLISTWYTRFEVQKRYAILYIIGTTAMGGAGILAFGLAKMKGLAGLNGWNWIFIMEGVISTVIGIVSYWTLVDFPEKAGQSWSFITPRERDFLVSRVHNDRGDENLQPFTMKRFFVHGLDPMVWGFALLNFCTSTISYAIAYFLPIILQEELGFSQGAAQCLTAPPYVLGGIIAYIVSWVGDKYRVRAHLLFGGTLLMVIGLSITAYAKIHGVRYFGVFLLVTGTVSNVPALLAYQANNICGQWKRAFTAAAMISFGGIGGIAGSLIFRSQDAPGYRPGLIGCLACCGLNFTVMGLMTLNYIWRNRAQARGAVNEGIPDFRYTY